jgi:Domain of unknown function (DUF932)
MEAGTLIAHIDTEYVTREQLALVPVPRGTDTHKPVPHHEIVDALIETLGFRNIGVHAQQYSVSKDGNKFFGVMELESGFTGARFALGLRNSHNKTLALALTVGFRVFCCDNLAFHGDYTPLMKKHTRNMNLLENLSVGIDAMQRNFKPLVEAVDRWRDTQLSDVSAKMFIYEAFIEGALEVPRHLAREVHKYYFEPPHEEFQPRTFWSLQNSFTGAFKQLDPIPLQIATAQFARYVEARKF